MMCPDVVSCPANKLHNRPRLESLPRVPTRQKGASFVIASAAKQSHGVVEQALEIASSLSLLAMTLTRVLARTGSEANCGTPHQDKFIIDFQSAGK